MMYELPVYPYRAPPELGGARKRYPVIVVGAGLAGLTAALELGARGIETVVLDEDNTVGAQGLSSRGICYAKRSLEIFDRFGVAARIRAKGVTWNEGEVYRGTELLYRFNLQPEADQKFPAFVNLQQFYVEQYLVERLQQVAGVDLRWKNRVLGVSQDADGVSVRVETPDGIYEARCDYLLAADGGHSTVRGAIGAEDEERSFYEDRWCIADVRMPEEQKRRSAPVRKAYLDGVPTEGGAIWYHQMADGVWRTDWQITHLPDPDRESSPDRAKERLRKLVGEEVRFELVWVGPWRFKKRLLKRLVHGRVIFLGDAAHEHSPFGARGGNSGIQDANNLAWKLALVLEGKASPALLETYHEERHFAARDNTENATRSAIFIGPETVGQRLVRNAILDLAQREPWARRWVNVGRLSVATVYADSRLNSERGRFLSDLAKPGAAAPDARVGDGYFVDRLGGEFRTVFFRPEERSEPLYSRYGVPAEGATYVFRPDGHVLARCTGIDEAFARQAMQRVFDCSGQGKEVAEEQGLGQVQIDRIYDAFSEFFDAHNGDREVAAQCVRLAEKAASYGAVLEAVRRSRSALELVSRLAG